MILSSPKSLVYSFLCTCIWFSLSIPGYSQNPQTSPFPGNAFSAAPVPGMAPASNNASPNNTGAGVYRRLPISIQSASVRLEELRNLMPNSRPKEFQDAVGDYLEWLSDMADSHWRIHLSFSKVESLKSQAEQEKQTTLKLGQLKRQAMLLKAEFLIRANRQPEALAPLVDIVVAEPKTDLGRSAYGLLKEIGFSEEAPLVIVPTSAAVPASATEEPAVAPADPATTVSTAAAPVAPVSKAVSTKDSAKSVSKR